MELKVKGSGRQVWEIETDEGVLLHNQQGSSSIYTFRPMGWLRFDKPGKHTLTVRLTDGDRQNASLSAISLKPVLF